MKKRGKKGGCDYKKLLQKAVSWTGFSMATERSRKRKQYSLCFWSKTQVWLLFFEAGTNLTKKQTYKRADYKATKLLGRNNSLALIKCQAVVEGTETKSAIVLQPSNW